MQFHGWRIRECTLIDWHGTPIFRVMARDRGEDARTVLGAPRHWSDLVHRRGEGHRAVPADAAVSWPETAHSAKGRGTDDGAPRFRADGKSRQTCGDDCAGAGRGAACPAGGIPGVFGFKLQGRGGKAIAHSARELDHRGFSEHHRAHAAQMIDHGRVVIEYLVRIRLGAPCRRKSFDCEQVFCGERNPVQRASVVAALDFLFRCLRLFEGNLRRQEGIGVIARPELLAAIEVDLCQFDGRELLRLNAFRKCAYS